LETLTFRASAAPSVTALWLRELTKHDYALRDLRAAFFAVALWPSSSPRPSSPVGALVHAVYASRLFPAVWAPAGSSGGRRLHHKNAGGVDDALHSHIDPGKQHSLDRFARHAGSG
jgi:hypothetical protein